MSGESVPRVRLAELVAALSLGIDLGFGQPMEHVLRQCLIALRLAERIGLDDEARAVVYYTALLVNVGCHSDAHEQAKWFGDDIALKSGKYEHEFRSLRGAARRMRLLGVGQPAAAPLPGRARVRARRATATGRHDRPARRARATLAEQLGLPTAVLDALGAAYETVGRAGWPGELKGDADADGVADRAARRVRRGRAPRRRRRGGAALARKRAGKQFDPGSARRLLRADAGGDPSTASTRSRPGTR